jgi:predicted site-specific integrase-resolvase
MTHGGGERITRGEAARRLDVALVTIDRYLREGRLSRHKNRVTGRVTLSAAEVELLRRERAH